MTDNIVARLRDLGDHASFEPAMHHKAADEIERLRAQVEYERQWRIDAFKELAAQDDEIEKLEAALRALIAHTLDCEKQLDEFHGLGNDAGSGMSSVVCEARAALAGEKTND